MPEVVVQTPGIVQSEADEARIKQRMLANAPVVQTPGVQETAGQKQRIAKRRSQMLAVAAASRKSLVPAESTCEGTSAATDEGAASARLAVDAPNRVRGAR